MDRQSPVASAAICSSKQRLERACIGTVGSLKEEKSPMLQILKERMMDDMNPLMGEIELFPYERIPEGWMSCEGQTLLIGDYETPFHLLGTTFGGDGKTNFCLPDLRKSSPMQSVGIQFCIAVNGIYPSGPVTD
jgi:hypothetical protein